MSEYNDTQIQEWIVLAEKEIVEWQKFLEECKKKLEGKEKK